MKPLVLVAVLALAGCSSFIEGLKKSGAEVRLGFLGAEVAVGFHGKDIASAVVEPATYVLNAKGITTQPVAPVAPPVAADPTAPPVK